MPRIPDQDLQRLKEEVSVARLVEASGVELKRAGKDQLGLCPFHEDREASLVVTAAKNLWHCFGCQIGGGPIDWVMKAKGVSFRHAVELLKAEMKAEMSGGLHTSTAEGNSFLAAEAGMPAKRSTVRALPPPVALDADDQALVTQTIDYYHQRLKESPKALAYLKARGLAPELHPTLVDTFRLGVADRTLGLRLPQKNRVNGATIRERLQKIGFIRESGHERFNGSLVVPVFDEAGNVAEVYGRKLLDNLREGTPKHMYLPGPHAGVFNLAGVIEAGTRAEGEREVILCEALIDAMTFWCAGFTHVTSSYGVEGFTDDILAAFKAHGIERVLIAYDRDDAGDRGADKLAPKLIAEGFEVLRVLFPKGMDANEYGQKMTPARQAFALVLRQARWIGSGRPAPAGPPTEPIVREAATATSEATEPTPEAIKANDAPSSLAAETGPSSAPIVPTVPAVSTVLKVSAARPLEDDVPADLPDELRMTTGACEWRIRAWKKNTSTEAMRVNLHVRRAGGGDGDDIDGGDGGDGANASAPGYHMDTLDLYAARARAAFVRQAGLELGLGEDGVKRELGAVLLKLEALQDDLLAQARGERKASDVPVLSAEEEAEALAFLRGADLPARIVADLQSLGVVGEETNLLAAYLAAVSRKLDTPLAVLVQSTSAAGKSSLMDAVLALVPPEDRIRYSAMTGQSLYYLGETSLQNKILAISEEEGVRQAAYALKLLQSEGELTMASTAKDEQTGTLMTRQYTVKGPVMLMLTTTAIDVDEELLNRCMVLAVDESRAQTAAIHARQRQRQTLAGLLEGANREGVERLHHNAQRLLAPVAVVNPWADQLTFLSDKTRTRRDHMKYLALIRAIALLHQHQREVKTIDHRAQTLSYIEVSKSDIALANRLAHEVLGRTLDELPPQTRRLLGLVREMVRERARAERIQPADVRFTRRDIREATAWSDNQLKVHCQRLADMEYLLVHGGSRGHSLRYELLWDGSAEDDDSERRLCGLIDAGELDENPPPPSLRRAKVGVSGSQVGAELASSWPQVGGVLDPLKAPLTRASLGMRPDAAASAAEMPIKALAPSSSAAVVAMAAAGG